MGQKGQIAENLFRDGYNCAQAVVLAFASDYGLSDNMAKAITSGLGAGMGRLREVCGVVSGAFIIMGLAYDGKKTKTELYTLEQKFASEFEKENGSIICRTLLGLRQEKKSNPAPQERTAEYYSGRPCAKLVNYSADLLENFLAENK